MLEVRSRSQQFRAWHEINYLSEKKLPVQTCMLATIGGYRVVNFVPGTNLTAS
jgi:hypothetical protein